MAYKIKIKWQNNRTKLVCSPRSNLVKLKKLDRPLVLTGSSVRPNLESNNLPLYSEEGFYLPIYPEQQQQLSRIDLALGKLQHAPQWISDWPDSSVKLGQVSGVALDNNGQLLVFHRASNVWDQSTFTERNVYSRIGEDPIPHPTILVFNDTGDLVDTWGQNQFYMPHGITVDKEGNVWLTDVALHQVFMFTPQKRNKPTLVLGEKFVPGTDDNHFCKPSAVAVLDSGDFFVADGYCNHRIIKFSSDGSKILQWGKEHGNSPFVLDVPHALTLASNQEAVCVADRERGRVGCFRSDNGTFITQYANSLLIGGRVFSVAYTPVQGGRLYVVNGPGTGVPVRGYVIDYASGQLLQTFAPPNDFSNPHDVVVSNDGTKVYVAELNPHKVYKFVDEALLNETHILAEEKREPLKITKLLKPTKTEDIPGAGERWEWGGVGGAAAGAGGAAVVVGAVIALRAASSRGKPQHLQEAEPFVP